MTTTLMKTTTLLFCRRRKTTTTGGKGRGGVLLPSSWERRTLRTRSRKRTAATKAADDDDDDDDGNNKSNKIGPTAAEPTAMDAETFNQLVSLGTWDKIVPECKRLALIGKITNGVLGQAYVVLTACKNQGEDENVLKTLENIIQLLTQTLLQLEADSPSKRALDEMMTLNPDETFDGKAACREIAERRRERRRRRLGVAKVFKELRVARRRVRTRFSVGHGNGQSRRVRSTDRFSHRQVRGEKADVGNLRLPRDLLES